MNILYNPKTVRKVHYYKTRSRLGIVNPLSGKKDLNIGVEDAPDAILTQDFLSKFENAQLYEFTFSKPEDIDKSKYFDILASELSKFKELINATLKPHETQVVIGGDNSVVFTSLLTLLERTKDPDSIGYIQFDSHGDLNLHKTSPSKNFHGMYMRPFFDSFDIPKIKNLINSKLSPENTLFFGNLELDKEEKTYFDKSKFKNISKEYFLKNRNKVLKELRNFIESFEHLHINFDIDVFSSKDVRATGMPGVKGFMMSEISPILRTISSHPNLSLDLSEVNPKKDGSTKTISVAQKVTELLLSD